MPLKKNRYDAVGYAQSCKGVIRLNKSKLCERAGMTRQNFYKSRRVRQRKQVDERLVKVLVNAERALQPRLGGVKLHFLLRDLSATVRGRHYSF